MQIEPQQLARSFEILELPDGFYDDPYPVYRALQTYQPVKRMRNGSYFVTRYDDLVAIYKNATCFSSDKKIEFKPKYGDTALYEHHTTSLVFNDPPLHTRVRRLIAGALTPRAIAELEPALVAWVDRLLDKMSVNRDVDLIADFASAIPVEVIGNMLAVPQQDREPLRDWSLAILSALEPVIGEELLARGNAAVEDFLAYLESIVAERRRRPGDPDKDVLTRLIRGEKDGEQLSAPELLHNCIFLLNAGHETTTNLIGNALVTLCDHPFEKRRLIAHQDLTRTAVEEFLRYESSNQFGNRITTQAVTVGGVEMPAGTQITLCIGAANRDPAQFPDPDRLDVGRTPNRHLAFGTGIHQCAGMALARLEAAIAISRFLARFPNYALSGETVRGRRARFRGFLRVPARLA